MDQRRHAIPVDHAARRNDCPIPGVPAYRWCQICGSTLQVMFSASKTVTATTNDPGKGSQTYYYTNAQSARLMFYHDHAYGITRLNVYAGDAAGYLLTDKVEQDLINGTNVTGVNPGWQKILPDVGIPLIIQDKTFVDADTIARPGSELEMGNRTVISTRRRSASCPENRRPLAAIVYMPAQNPYDLSGANAFGRWQYGPWFWPPTPITYPPVANEYYDPNCDAAIPWCEPPFMPPMPNPSMGMEAFKDTMLVNGTLYPY